MNRLLIFLMGIAIILPVSAALAADVYPAKTVRIVVAFAAGGSTDLLARSVAQRLNEAWKQSVIVDNRAGGGGIVGSDYVAKAPADGYTLLLGTNTTNAVAVSLYAKLPFDPQRDFAPITEIATIPQMLSVHPSLPTKSLKELVALAKKNPGKLNYSSSGTGGNNHAGHGKTRRNLLAAWTLMRSLPLACVQPLRAGANATGPLARRSMRLSTNFPSM